MGQMKDSGVKWIGEVPEGWRILPVNYCFQEIVNLNTNLEENNALQFKMGEIISKKDGNSKYTPETLEGYNIVEPGDIMINGLNLSFDLISQRVAMVRNNGVITSTYLAIRPKDNTQSSYAQYLLKSYDNAKALHGMGRGLRATLTYNYFRREPFILPPLPEQERIAAYLDEKCGDIDRLVSIQEEMIEELKAYKQSLITEAVTKGLDPNAKLKPSGIEWIGEIPEGWEVVKLSRISKVITDYVASGSFADLAENVTYLDEPDFAMLVRTIDVSNKGYKSSPVYVNKESYDFLSNSNLFGGELMLPNIGASVGDIYIVPNLYKYMTLAPNSIMLKTNMCDKYYYYYFLSKGGRESLLDIAQSTAQPKFNKTDFRSLRVILPPLPTQRAIASYLDTKTAEIDRLINLKQQKITELKDYKKSLIYECVTGKKEIV